MTEEVSGALDCLGDFLKEFTVSNALLEIHRPCSCVVFYASGNHASDHLYDFQVSAPHARLLEIHRPCSCVVFGNHAPDH